MFPYLGNNSSGLLEPYILTYSRVPNKRTGRLLENEKKTPAYTHLFGTIRLLIFN